MKICNVCGFSCEEEMTVCPTCGKNCDGSEQPKTENSPKATDPFEKYRKEIDDQIKQQEKIISELQEKMKTENQENNSPKKKEKAFDEFDKTELFSEEDVKNNRLFAVLIYLTGAVGIIISMIYDKNSPYLSFHRNEGIKIAITEALILLVSLLLFWTFIIPVLGTAALITLNVIKLISASWTLKGQSKEALILRNINILK